MEKPTLLLMTSALNGASQSVIGDITEMAGAWQRSTRINGGFWLGSFVIEDKISLLKSFFHDYKGAHLKEQSAGVTTWEGMIYDMDLPDPPAESGEENSRLSVGVCGYAHTASWRFVTTATATGAMANVSAWINDLVVNHCSDFLVIGQVDTNTLQVKRALPRDMRAWEAIVDATMLGDANADPWCSYVDVGRRFYYKKIDMAPIYWVRGGVTRRWSYDLMANYVDGTFIDENNEVQPLAAVSQAQSIETHGRREEKIYMDTVPLTAAQKRRDFYLKENSWPWARGIGSIDVQVETPSGEIARNPWSVRPGVYRDMSYILGGADVGFWLPDARDFLVEEVTCGVETGLSLSTWQFEESEQLAIQEEYRRWLERQEEE